MNYFGSPDKLLSVAEFKKLHLGANRFKLDHVTRHRHIEKVGFHIVTTELIEGLAPLIEGEKIVEVMAGSGFLSACLQKKGVKIEASDNHTWWAENQGRDYLWKHTLYTDVVRKDCAEAVKGADTVIMCWPYMDNNCVRVLDAMKPGAVLLHQGEPPGGCTGVEDFWDTTGCEVIEELEAVHLQFPGLYDRWMRWRKP